MEQSTRVLFTREQAHCYCNSFSISYYNCSFGSSDRINYGSRKHLTGLFAGLRWTKSQAHLRIDSWLLSQGQASPQAQTSTLVGIYYEFLTGSQPLPTIDSGCWLLLDQFATQKWWFLALSWSCLSRQYSLTSPWFQFFLDLTRSRYHNFWSSELLTNSLAMSIPSRAPASP